MPNINCTEEPTQAKQCGAAKPMISAFVWNNNTLKCKEILYRGCDRYKRVNIATFFGNYVRLLLLSQDAKLLDVAEGMLGW